MPIAVSAKITLEYSVYLLSLNTPFVSSNVAYKLERYAFFVLSNKFPYLAIESTDHSPFIGFTTGFVT